MEKVLYKSRTYSGLTYPWYFNFPYYCPNKSCLSYNEVFYFTYRGDKGDIVKFNCAFCDRTWIQKM